MLRSAVVARAGDVDDVSKLVPLPLREPSTISSGAMRTLTEAQGIALPPTQTSPERDQGMDAPWTPTSAA
jgi:hypothetical protein